MMKKASGMWYVACRVFIVFCVAATCYMPYATYSYAALHLNELYPAPSTGDTEWVEIFNDGSTTESLSTYRLTDLDGNTITLPATIPGNSFIIATASSTLNNTGDTLYLKTASNSAIIDSISYTGTWASGKSYGRCPDTTGLWNTLTLQTKSLSNAPACLLLTPTPSPTTAPTNSPTPSATEAPAPTTIPTATIAPTPTIDPTLYDNIILSEVMVNPPPGENEWVELYNGNTVPVTLTEWYIDDEENTGSSPKVFTSTIPALGFITIEMTSSMFNNAGDAVRVLDAGKNTRNTFIYTSSEQGVSWGKKTGEDSFCKQISTQGEANGSCLIETLPATLTQTDVFPTPTRLISYSVAAEKISDSTPLSPHRQTRVIHYQTQKHATSQTSEPMVLSAETNAYPAIPLSSIGFSLLSITSIAIKRRFGLVS